MMMMVKIYLMANLIYLMAYLMAAIFHADFEEKAALTTSGSPI